jgi:hypothetical protein
LFRGIGSKIITETSKRTIEKDPIEGVGWGERVQTNKSESGN